MTSHGASTPGAYLHGAGQVGRPQYRADIDGLRAVAVLLVVGFHAFPDWVAGGFIGVDIFFVISGFLISTIIVGGLEQNRFSLLEFYSRRIRRIFPALVLVLLATYAFGWFTLLAGEYKQLGKHIAGGAAFVSNFVLWNESGYFDRAAATKPLLHLWSLGIEEQFYIAWPLLLWMVWRRRLNLLTVVLAVGVLSFALNVAKVGNDAVAVFYSPQTRLWELVVGSVLACIVLRKRSNADAPTLSLDRWPGPAVNVMAPGTRARALYGLQSALGAALIAIGLFVTTKETHFPGWIGTLPIAGALFIIAAGPGAWLNRKVLSNRVLVWFGLISFPLYLWHWPLLAFARIVESERTPPVGTRIVAVLIAIALAWLTFRLLERPVRFGNSGKVKAISLLASMLIVGCMGYAGYEQDGLAFRPVNKGIGYYFYDWRSGYRYQKCFIDGTDSKSDTFAEVCSGTANQTGNTPLVVLWGDSHAASLYRGLFNQSESFGYSVAQYTTSGCTPVVNFKANSKECGYINDFVLQQIKKYRPDTVFISAYWAMHDGKNRRELLDDKTIEETVLILKSYDIKHIVLVGQLPIFKTDQPAIARDVFIAGKSNRTFKHFDASTLEFDQRIGAIARNNDVEFISPTALLCTTSGCLISVSMDKIIPLAFDYAHLTEDGSNFLIQSALRKNLISLPKR